MPVRARTCTSARRLPESAEQSAPTTPHNCALRRASIQIALTVIDNSHKRQCPDSARDHRVKKAAKNRFFHKWRNQHAQYRPNNKMLTRACSKTLRSAAFLSGEKPTGERNHQGQHAPPARNCSAESRIFSRAGGKHLAASRSTAERRIRSRKEASGRYRIARPSSIAWLRRTTTDFAVLIVAPNTSFEFAPKNRTAT